MESREMRIGNLVLKDGVLFGLQIIHIAHTNIGIEPIPLTEQWLVKLGLLFNNRSEEIVTYNLISSQNISVVLQNNERGRLEYNHSHLCYVDYVHQLQNLYFGLTGEELTIKKPSV